MYHGTADGLIPTRSSNTYYDRVSDAMDAPPTDFFRYFQVPGMQHCWETAVEAPWYFAAPFQAGILGNDTWSVPGFRDAEHDILLALVVWVEEGKAVESVVATTWNVGNDSDSGILRQRRLCPYPGMAVYDGEGNMDEAASWHCEVECAKSSGDMRRPGGAGVGVWVLAVVSLVALL